MPDSSNGNWQGVDLNRIPIPDDLSECHARQRRAYIYERVKEEGHPSLIDTQEECEKLDVSRRQIYYDLDAIAEFIESFLGEHHTGENWTVFEKAKREALREGDWKGAVEILEKEAEWLERRGAINTEPEEHEITWREYIESSE
jgi:hypothetical protein